MIGADKASAIILSSVSTMGSITQSLERSLNCVLAEDIFSGENIPPFDNSAMDGVAVKSADIERVPATLTVVGEIAAGAVPPKALGTGEAMNIMTGAKLPAGADAVVPQEWAENAEEGRVRILKSVQQGQNVRVAGSDVQKGELTLKKHQSLRPQEIGLLASLGKQFVNVYRRPSVAILATGNEIAEITAPVREGKIRNSNAYALSALIRQLGCEPVMLGVAFDDRGELRNKIAVGLEEDVLITTGGVSVGKYDLVIEVMKQLGVDVRFWKINIKPGMPMMFGMSDGTPVFGLPGNPVSTMVTYLQFVRPALQKMMGHSHPEASFRISAHMEHDFTKSDGKRHFMRGILERRNGSFFVRSTGSQTSNILSSMSKANCLIVLPETLTELKAGDIVEVEVL